MEDQVAITDEEASRAVEPAAIPPGVTALLGAGGATRVGLAVLAGMGGPVAYLDVGGWFCPLAAWEAGIAPRDLVVVRCSEPEPWARAAAALLEGMRAVHAEVPAGVPTRSLRRLAARARKERAVLLLRPRDGALPPGVASSRIVVEEVGWEGTDRGHGRLRRRRLRLLVAGRLGGGVERRIEVIDDGTGPLHLVPDVGTVGRRLVAG